MEKKEAPSIGQSISKNNLKSGSRGYNAGKKIKVGSVILSWTHWALYDVHKTCCKRKVAVLLIVYFQKNLILKYITEAKHTILTIILLYQQSRCENFKSFYVYYVKLLYGNMFPKLPSYSRFIRLKPQVLWYLALLLQWFCEQSKLTGISYIDATSIAVCHSKIISRNKVFQGLAKLGKSTYSWFFGFKLHLVINEIGRGYPH